MEYEAQKSNGICWSRHKLLALSEIISLPLLLLPHKKEKERDLPKWNNADPLILELSDPHSTLPLTFWHWLGIVEWLLHDHQLIYLWKSILTFCWTRLQKCLGGSVGYATDSRFQPRSWFQICEMEPCIGSALDVETAWDSLSLLLPLPIPLMRMLSLNK